MYYIVEKKCKSIFLQYSFIIEDIAKYAKHLDKECSAHLISAIKRMIAAFKKLVKYNLIDLFEKKTLETLPLRNQYFSIQNLLTSGDPGHPMFKTDGLKSFPSDTRTEMELFDIFCFLYYYVKISELCFRAFLQNKIDFKPSEDLNRIANELMDTDREVDYWMHPHLTLKIVEINLKFLNKVCKASTEKKRKYLLETGVGFIISIPKEQLRKLSLLFF